MSSLASECDVVGPGTRAVHLPLVHLPLVHLPLVHLPLVHLPLVRPRTRAECADVPRPCPYVSCRHNTYLEVTSQGVRVNHPGLEPDEVPAHLSCSLDVAERGDLTMAEVGGILGISRQMVDRVEHLALLEVRALFEEPRRG